MKKRAVFLLFAISLLLCLVPTIAAAGEEEPNPASEFAYYVSEDHVEILGYIGKSINVVVPDHIEGKPVTVVRLGKSYYGAQKDFFTFVRRIVLPDTIMKLDDFAFGCYNSLLEVVGLENVEEIGEQVFWGSSLTHAEFSNKLKRINTDAFNGAESLLSVTIPDDVQYGFRSLVLSGTEEVHLLRGTGEATLKIVDNVLFSADGKTLIFALPSMRKAFYSIPEGTEVIMSGALNHNRFINEILFPTSVIHIDTGDDFSTDMIMDVYADSYAEDHFNRYNANEVYQRKPVSICIMGQDGIGGLQQIIDNIIAQTITDGMTDEQKAKALHDWICANAGYDYSLTHYDARSILTGGLGVCDAYARAYCILLDAVDIESRWVECFLNGPHAINLIKLNGKWYLVDCTNDDEGFGHPDELFCFDQYVFDQYYYGNLGVEANDLSLYAPYRNHRMDEAIRCLKAGIQTNLEKGEPFFSVTLEAEQAPGDTPSRALCSMMQQESWTIGGESYRIDCSTTDGVSYSCYLKSNHPLLYTYEAMDEDSICLTAYKGNETAVVVPASLEGKKVVALRGTFKNNDVIQRVTLPEGIQVIGDQAFFNCVALETINLPSTLVEIGVSAFNNCLSLHSDMLLPDGLRRIAIGAFNKCVSLEKVRIPGSVETFEDEVFYNCSKLSSVILEEGITELPNATFCYCLSLKTLDLPSSLRKIGMAVFVNSNIVKLEIPANVSEISWASFLWANRLSQLTVRGSNPSFAAKDGILYSRDMKKLVAVSGGIAPQVVIPNGVEEVGAYAFCMNENIRSVRIPSSVKSIKEGAFRDCDVETVYIEDGAEIIGPYAFATIGTSIPWASRSGTGSSIFDIRLPQTLKTIGEGAFWGNINIKALVLPASLVRIDVRIINWPQEIYIPDSIQYIAPQPMEYEYGENIVHGKAGSYAQTFAEENGFRFVDESEKIALSLTSLMLLPKGRAELQILMINGQQQAIDPEEVTWTSDQDCVTVDQGVLCAISPGDAAISASWNGLQATCLVHVPDVTDSIHVNYIGNFGDKMLRVGETKQMICSIEERYFDNGTECFRGYETYDIEGEPIVWTVSDDSVLSVNRHGYMEAVGPGQASVIATLPDGRFASFEWTVVGTAFDGTVDSGDTCQHEWGDIQTNKPATSAEEGEGSCVCSLCGAEDTIILPRLHVASVELETLPVRLVYSLNESFSADGGMIRVHCENDTEELVSLNKTVIDGFDSSAVGVQTLTVTYGGKTTTFEIEIVAKTLQSVAVSVMPDMITYLEGTAFSAAGGRLTLTYDDGTTEEIDLTENMVSGFDPNVVGVQTLTVTYEDKTTTFEVTVEHVPGEPVQENIVPATCATEGGYDEAVYCTVCHAELSREAHVTEKLAHTPDEPVQENIVPATCAAESGYDEVVYCTVCHAELSRTARTVEKSTVHTPGEPVRENEVPATTEKAGSYEEVVYCTVCHGELSREGRTIDQLPTTFTGIVTYRDKKTVYLQNEDQALLALLDDGEAAVEAGKRITVTGMRTTYKQSGYSIPEIVDAVVEAVADTEETVAATPATIAQLTDERMAWLVQVEATKQALAAAQLQLPLEGYADAARLTVTGVLSADLNGRVLLGATVRANHVPGEAVRENVVPATTEAEGSYDEVVYCSTCGEELSRERKVIEKLLHEHTPGAPVRENEVKATTTTRGHYDEAVYCSVCGEELSREEKVINKSIKGLTITGEPEDAKVKNGEKATFTVKIRGKATAIQWYYRTSETAKWKKVSSKGNKVTLTVTGKPGNDGYQYRCELKNGKKKLYSDTVTLDVELFPPTISSQPESAAIQAGEEATFTFGVEGENVTYAWSYRKSATGKWATVKGGTSATLTVTGTAANAGYQYKCEAKNKDGKVTSDIVTLDVEYHLPEIVTQPKGVKVKKNAKVTFTVEANDPYEEKLTFQWYSRKSSKAKWTKIKGATEATYSFKATAKKSGYQYKCDITNHDGTVSSKAATLKVK